MRFTTRSDRTFQTKFTNVLLSDSLNRAKEVAFDETHYQIEQDYSDRFYKSSIE